MQGDYFMSLQILQLISRHITKFGENQLVRCREISRGICKDIRKTTTRDTGGGAHKMKTLTLASLRVVN